MWLQQKFCLSKARVVLGKEEKQSQGSPPCSNTPPCPRKRGITQSCLPVPCSICKNPALSSDYKLALLSPDSVTLSVFSIRLQLPEFAFCQSDLGRLWYQMGTKNAGEMRVRRLYLLFISKFKNYPWASLENWSC